jgi:tRNA (pseudouridine54-N1)-methyltransferase
MREFLLFSRKGYTDGNFRNLREAGRLDVVHQCVLMALFRSHGIRKDVIFHAVLGGPPSPPLSLTIEGSKLHDVRTDEKTWEEILREVLRGKNHPGISLARDSFQSLVRKKSEAGHQIFVLEERGKDIKEIQFEKDTLFILGDQVGLPIKDEKFALRYGKKLSLGKGRYLAASCVDIVNYVLDST